MSTGTNINMLTRTLMNISMEKKSILTSITTSTPTTIFTSICTNTLTAVMRMYTTMNTLVSMARTIMIIPVMT